MGEISQNPYWPCILIEHDDKYSIILSNFHYFDDYFGDQGCGGYTVERLAKKLLKGFVLSLDRKAQEDFFKYVPYPNLSKKQLEYIEAIQNGDEQTKINVAKKINSEARTLTRKWDNYLSHPQTIRIFLEAIDKEQNEKVYQELVWALVFICKRHLPDLRTKAYFLDCLTHKKSQIRISGIWGLCSLYEIPLDRLAKLKNDKSEKVKETSDTYIGHVMKNKGKGEFPSWMFKPENCIP